MHSTTLLPSFTRLEHFLGLKWVGGGVWTDRIIWEILPLEERQDWEGKVTKDAVVAWISDLFVSIVSPPRRNRHIHSVEVVPTNMDTFFRLLEWLFADEGAFLPRYFSQFGDVP